MKAAYYTQYGPPEVVTIREVPSPQAKANEVLVKVHATTVTAGDVRIRAARFPKGFAFFALLAFGLTKPRRHTLGMCFSGVVEAVGSDVTEFIIGDEVCGMTGIAMGAHAQYLTIRADKAIVKKPHGISHNDAAAILFGGTAALYFLRDQAHVADGDAVVINGASGAVGTAAVQLARHFGADVTAVTSGGNAELVTDLGATHIIDYTKESLTDNTQKFDVVLDAVGNIATGPGLKLLKPGGRLLLMVATMGQMITTGANKQIMTGTAAERKVDITLLLEMLKTKKIRAVIDKVYSFDDIALAHAHADGGNKKGNVIMEVTR